MRESKVIRNAGMAVAQVLVTGIFLFALFYFLLRTIGPTQLGIWSIVLSLTSTARLSELGLSGGVVKFVAQYIARSDEGKAAAVVETAALSIAGLIGIVLVPAYPFLRWLLGHILPVTSLSDALALLPFALLSLWLTAVGSVFLSGLDGARRIDLRSLIMMGGIGTQFALVVMLVPSYGLRGLAYAQVIQALIMLLVGWLSLRRLLAPLPIFPYRWNRDLFGEMFRYGLNFQFASLVQMMVDPLTKALLSKFGGLDSVSYYEMANRLVMQFRAVLVSANQVMVPVIAGMHESTPARIPSVYRDSYRLLLFLALPLYAGVGAMIPVISELWIGRYESSFVIFGWLLTGGWFFNTLIGPAYFSNLGTGRLRWNTLSQMAIGLLNGALGTFLGVMFGANGVVTGFVIALIIGSGLVVGVYHAENRIALSELVPKEYLRLAISNVLAASLSWAIYYNFRNYGGIAFVSVICLAVFIGIVFPPFWRHPMRSKLTGWMIDRRRKVGTLM